MKKKRKAILASLLVSAGLLACGKINDSIDTKPEIVEEHAIIEVEEAKPMNYQVEEKREFDFEYVYKYGYLKGNTSLYDLNGEIICNVDEYQKIYVIATNNIISAIEIEDGTRGFINNDKYSYLPDDYIEVDISDQLVSVYNDNERLLTADVVTGKPGNDTDMGLQEILGKDYNRYLDGPTWHVHVDYFFYFNYGEGFHDASWRNEFGDEIYKTNGSHGCVNMKHSDVEKMDELIEVGTKVLVHK